MISRDVERHPLGERCIGIGEASHAPFQTETFRTTIVVIVQAGLRIRRESVYGVPRHLLLIDIKSGLVSIRNEQS